MSSTTRPTRDSPNPALSRTMSSSRPLAASVLVRLVVGLAVSSDQAVMEPALPTLLRFMTVVKGGLALASLTARPAFVWAGMQVWHSALLLPARLLLPSETVRQQRTGWRHTGPSRA